MPMFGWNSQDGEKDPPCSDKGPRSPTDLLSDASTHSQHSTPPTGEREVTPDATKTRPSDAVVDPALIDQNSKGNNLSSFATLPPHNVDNTTNSFPPHQSSMPHRVEPMTTHRHHPYEHSHRRLSPPPIATLTHSPSPSVGSLDRSSVSTPPTRQSPPHRSTQSAPFYSAPYHPEIQQSRHYQQDSRFARDGHHGYMYNPSQFSEQHRYESNESQTHSPYNNPPGLPPHLPPPMTHPPTSQQAREYGNHSYPLPGQPNGTICYTDDAATKLSDRVRRRCFNCSTTDTSTWRRSNLSPGKVLCNKCGLFERTHSRPRPEQFPHRRGPIPGVSIRGRTPPAQLPPISPPYHYSHPSIAPLSSSTQEPRREYPSTTLPGLQTWHSDSGSHRMPPPPIARRTLEPNPHGRQPSPPAPRSQLTSQQETRDTPNARESTA